MPSRSREATTYDKQETDLPTLIQKPSRIEVAGNKPNSIDEYGGRVNSGESAVSIAHMRSPAGWIEPARRGVR